MKNLHPIVSDNTQRKTNKFKNRQQKFKVQLLQSLHCDYGHCSIWIENFLVWSLKKKGKWNARKTILWFTKYIAVSRLKLQQVEFWSFLHYNLSDWDNLPYYITFFSWYCCFWINSLVLTRWWPNAKIQCTHNPTPGKLPVSFELHVTSRNLCDFMHH